MDPAAAAYDASCRDGAYQIPTGTYQTRAAFAVKGGSLFDKRHFAATAVLVQHPEGDLLIDAGFGADVAQHIKMLPLIARAPFKLTRPVAEQLDASGYDRSRLLGVLVTHSHWDHVSGLAALHVPVWINRMEREYAAKDPDGAIYRRVSPDWRSTSTPSTGRSISVSQPASMSTVTVRWWWLSPGATPSAPWWCS